MTLEEALAALKGRAVPGRSTSTHAYHKIDRPYLGVPNPKINTLTSIWRRTLEINDQVALAEDLWRTNIFEARLAAAKLLTQTRIKDDQHVWQLLLSFAPDFDSWAIADHVCMAGQKRLYAHPYRLLEIEEWTSHSHMWRKRAALVISLPFAKPRTPSESEINSREIVLGWAASYVQDSEWFIQKAVAWWIRDLSKHQPVRAREFLSEHGASMKPFARREASKYL